MAVRINHVQYLLDRSSLFGAKSSITLFEYECDPTISEYTELAPFLVIASVEDHDTTLSAVGTLEDAAKRINYEIYGDNNQEDAYTKSVSFKVIDRKEKVLYRYNKQSKSLEKQDTPVSVVKPKMTITTKIVVKEEPTSDLLVIGFVAFIGASLAFLISKA